VEASQLGILRRTHHLRKQIRSKERKSRTGTDPWSSNRRTDSARGIPPPARGGQIRTTE
jgi:hypothetical protein